MTEKQMKLLLAVLLLWLGFACVAAPEAWGQAIQIQWNRQFGTSGPDNALAISADSSGEYVAGFTCGALPGQVRTGLCDAFVRKYDANGNELWTRQFGVTNSQISVVAFAISRDSSGVYVAGQTNGALAGQVSAGGADAFVRKYDANGNELWTRQFGTTAFDQAEAISADSSGVYVAGHTVGTLPGQSSAGFTDAFVRKYDANGNEVWTRQFGTTTTDVAESISADSSGVYVGGFTFGTLPGQVSSGAGVDAFVRKYDANGNEVWTRQFGFAVARAISADSSGVYVAGTTLALPGQVNVGSIDAFVRKYDANGNEVWTRQFGTTEFDSAEAISVGSSGVHVAGWTGGALPGQTNAGSLDAFVRTYDVNGNEVLTSQFGTAGEDRAQGISAHSSAVYVAGITDGVLPGQMNAGGQDAFVVKLPAATPSQLIQQLIAQVVSLNLKQGIANSLDSKLDAVLQALSDVNQNNNVAAINALQAFINAVQAQRGISISPADADALIAAAQAIITQLSSP